MCGLPGIHIMPPDQAAVPPIRSSFSKSPTVAPSALARIAAVSPAAPVPSTTTSNSSTEAASLANNMHTVSDGRAACPVARHEDRHAQPGAGDASGGHTERALSERVCLRRTEDERGDAVRDFEGLGAQWRADAKLRGVGPGDRGHSPGALL